jgi:uncharacterized protein
MQLILDTSVLISSLISSKKSFTKDILRLAFEDKVTLLATDETFKEIKKTLGLEKVKKAPSYNSSKTGSFIAWYKYNAHFIKIPSAMTPSTISRDNDDNKYLLLAQLTKAEYLITLDKDLLVLKAINTTKIVTPEMFILKERK